MPLLSNDKIALQTGLQGRSHGPVGPGNLYGGLKWFFREGSASIPVGKAGWQETLVGEGGEVNCSEWFSMWSSFPYIYGCSQRDRERTRKERKEGRTKILRLVGKETHIFFFFRNEWNF